MDGNNVIQFSLEPPIHRKITIIGEFIFQVLQLREINIL